jgi:hypothetical protein
MNNMVLQRLGSIAPGNQDKENKKSGRDIVDPNPIVLWGHDKPAAILYFRRKEGSLDLEQTFAKLPSEGSGGSSLGGLFNTYPIRFRESGLTEMVTPSLPNAYYPDGLATGDVNGDGVDELILARAHGDIEVYSAEKQLHSFSGERHLPRGYYYIPHRSHTVRLKGRDVVFLTSKLDNPRPRRGEEKEPGVDTPGYAVHRVDKHGIARVTLRGEKEPPEEIRAFGALTRSSDIDELLVVALKGFRQRKNLLFRYRPDGTAIGDPKEFPLGIGTGLKFLSAPESPYAILRDGAKVHFIAPEKPFNWIQTVDFGQVGGKNDKVDVLHVTDAKSDPKVVVSLRKRLPDGKIEEAAELFAVNAAGHCFAPEPGGRGWRQLAGRKPYHRMVPPSPLHEFVNVIPSSDGSDDLLVVYSRKAQTQKLTHEEILAAAEKFLMPGEVQAFRERLVIHIDDMKVAGEEEFAVQDERQAKGMKRAIATVEDWKRFLPESYASTQKDKASSAYRSLERKLHIPLDSAEPLSPERYRNLDEYRAWLSEQAIGPESRFVLLRGDFEVSWDVQARVGRSQDAVAPGGPVAFRSATNDVMIVFSADASKVPDSGLSGLSSEERLPGFFMLGPAGNVR